MKPQEGEPFLQAGLGRTDGGEERRWRTKTRKRMSKTRDTQRETGISQFQDIQAWILYLSQCLFVSTSILQLAVLVQASSFFLFASSPFLIILAAR